MSLTIATGTRVVAAIPTGQTTHARVAAVGSTFTVTLTGAQVGEWSYLDSTVTAANKAGVAFAGAATNTTAIHLDRVMAVNLTAGSPIGPTPATSYTKGATFPAIRFNLSLPEGTTLSGPVTITPISSAGASFSPTSAVLSQTVRSVDLTLIVTGPTTISFTNNGGLTDPAPYLYTPAANSAQVDLTQAAIAAIASALLVNPAHPLATDELGRVTVITNLDKTGYTATSVTDRTGYGLAPTQSFNNTGQTAKVPSSLAAGDVTGNLPAAANSLPTTVPAGYGGTGATATQLAAAILANPRNLLVTDATGKVGANNLPTDYQQRTLAVILPTTAPAGYGGTGATATQLAAAILVTPGQKIATDTVGSVSMSMTQPIPLLNTAQTVGDALNAARAQGFGKWIIDANAKTFKLFGPDGTTVVRTFAIDSLINPSTRT